MYILPIRSLASDDKDSFDDHFVNLGYLSRDNFSVSEGLIIKLSENELTDYINFQLSQELKKNKSYYWQKKLYKDEIKLWKDLVKFWSDEKRFKRARGHKDLQLSSQIIYFQDKMYPQVSAYFDPDMQDIAIRSEVKLSPQYLRRIDEIVTKANKRLLLPYIFYFFVQDEPIIFRLEPFTHNLPINSNTSLISKVNPKLGTVRLRSAVDVFYKSQGELIDGADGVYFEDLNNLNFDEKILTIENIVHSFKGPIIYQLPNIQDEDLDGTRRLIEQNSLLINTADAFLFLRNKKGLLSLELAIPLVRSSEEYLQLKRDLAIRGITRKGSLKYWLEIAVPENLININDYLVAGLDGVIVNLDSLKKMLIGYKDESTGYYNDNKILIDFLLPAFKLLHKNKIPILINSENDMHLDVLEKFVEVGIKGVIVGNKNEAESMPEHLNWVEKRVISRRFLN